MTLLPTAPRRIGKAEGPRYFIDKGCSHPYCLKPVADAHHIVRRSWVGKESAWVSIDGVARPNLVGLCRAHHQELTENKARIYWDGDEETKEGEWRWHEGVKPGHGRGSTTWYDVGPLEPALSEGGSPGSDAVDPVDHPPPSESAEHECSATCDCGKVLTRKRRKKSEPGVRRNWSIWVPTDAENGAALLDELLEAARDQLKGKVSVDDDTPNYYVISYVLAAFLHFQENA